MGLSGAMGRERDADVQKCSEMKILIYEIVGEKSVEALSNS